MGSAVIVVGKVRVKLVEEVLAVVGRIQVDVLPFDRAPAVSDEGIIGGPAPAVAADAAAGGQQGLFIGQASKLAALVRVEDERRRVLGQRRVPDVRQKPTSGVFDNSQLSTYRACQSSTATR